MTSKILFPLLSLVCVVLILGWMLAGCEKDAPVGVYDPQLGTGAQPAIDSVTPPGFALAGAQQLTIYGKNFSPSANDNIVFFNAKSATILSCTSTQIKVSAPIDTGTFDLKVSTSGAEHFSNKITYQLLIAVAPFGGLGNFDQPYAIACDSAGNVYVSETTSGVGIGIKKFHTPAGVKSDFAPKGGETFWTSLKFGPGGFLYAARSSFPVIFRFAPTGGASAVWAAAGLGKVYDFDFDAQYNIWGCANDTVITRIKPDKSGKKFVFKANSHAIRVFNNDLYVAAKVDSVEAIWKFNIVTSDSLGLPVKYFDMAQYNSTSTAFVLTFSSDGYLFVGTDGPDGIILIHPDQTWEPLYQGLFDPVVSGFAWGTGSDLYSTNQYLGAKALKKINTQKSGAPYYGRQ